MARKRPYVMFFTGDWMKDPCLSLCSPSTRGIWIDALCCMHELGNGELRGSLDQLSRALRCSISELETALGELETTGAATIKVENCNEDEKRLLCNRNENITEVARNRNAIITLINRRMCREAKLRANNALRQKHFRSNANVTQLSRECHANVTSASSYSYSVSLKEKEEKNKEEKEKTPGAVAPPPRGNPTQKRFAKPTLAELAEYMNERGWKEPDHMAQKFFDHYESCGWKVGKKGPMKDWRAAVRTWENNSDGVDMVNRKVMVSETYEGQCCVCGASCTGRIVAGVRDECFCAECEATLPPSIKRNGSLL